MQIHKRSFSHVTVYVFNLMALVFDEAAHDHPPYVDAVQRILVPQDLSAQQDRPPIEHVIAESHVSVVSV